MKMITDLPDEPVLYFAYGSNLSLMQMQERCPGARPIAPAILPGHRLIFAGEGTVRWGRGGVATAVADSSAKVRGALYELSHQHVLTLDGFEGVDLSHPQSGKYTRVFEPVGPGGASALLYVATARLGEENKPNRRYLDRILAGYSDWGLLADGLPELECYAASERWP